MSSKKNLGIILTGLLVVLIGLLPASVQAAKPDGGLQASCALLDNPASRGLMSGMFETNLLIACKRPRPPTSSHSSPCWERTCR